MALRDLEDVSHVAQRLVVEPCGDRLARELWVRESEVTHGRSIARLRCHGIVLRT